MSDLNDIVNRPQNIVVSHVRGSSIQERLETLLASANENVHYSRKVLYGELEEASARAFSKHFSELQAEQIEFKAAREIENFLETAITGRKVGNSDDYLDLLSPGHPLSKSPEISQMPEEELRQARAEWISGDPRIDENYRPLVASAYASEKGSIERKFFVSRLSSESLDSIPVDIIVGLENQ